MAAPEHVPEDIDEMSTEAERLRLEDLLNEVTRSAERAAESAAR